MAGYSSVAPVMGILQLSTICLKEQITCLLVELIGPKGVGRHTSTPVAARTDEEVLESWERQGQSDHLQIIMEFACVRYTS